MTKSFGSLADCGRYLQSVLPCSDLYISRAMEYDDTEDPILLAYRFFGQLASLLQECLQAADEAAPDADLAEQSTLQAQDPAAEPAAAQPIGHDGQDQEQQSDQQPASQSSSHAIQGHSVLQPSGTALASSGSEVVPAVNGRYNQLEFSFGSRLSSNCQEAHWHGRHIVVKTASKARQSKVLKHEVMLQGISGICW